LIEQLEKIYVACNDSRVYKIQLMIGNLLKNYKKETKNVEKLGDEK
jgi:hypothetical protein